MDSEMVKSKEIVMGSTMAITMETMMEIAMGLS